MSTKFSTLGISIDRLQAFSSELRLQAPQWADRLEQIQTEKELRQLICDLFNLSHALVSEKKASANSHTLSARITCFVSKNLHHGMTLKVLANFLGYSEKYCSDLFCRIMGESFSSYIRRHRVERAKALLTTTGQTLAEISAALGFSDQFAFSHFFKRATGYSPQEIRPAQTRQRDRQTVHSFRESP